MCLSVSSSSSLLFIRTPINPASLRLLFPLVCLSSWVYCLLGSEKGLLLEFICGIVIFFFDARWLWLTNTILPFEYCASVTFIYHKYPTLFIRTKALYVSTTGKNWATELTGNEKLRSQAFVNPSVVSRVSQNSVRLRFVFRTTETDTVVDSRRLTLPKFHHFRNYRISTPEGIKRNIEPCSLSINKLVFQLPVFWFWHSCILTCVFFCQFVLIIH